MHRIDIIKRTISTGLRFVPNRTRAYRLCSGLGEQVASFVTHQSGQFQVDHMTVEDVPVTWINHRKHCSPRVILYLHGGGFVFGSAKSHLLMASRIARASKAQVVVAEYRLAPEHPHPAALDDALAVYRYLLDSRIAAENIVLAGDSAGGGLSVSLAQKIQSLGLPTPAGTVCLSPWLDLSCHLSAKSFRAVRDPVLVPGRVQSFAKQYAAGFDLQFPEISPLFGELRSLPPMLIQVGSNESLITECRQFAERAQDRGSRVSLEI